MFSFFKRKSSDTPVPQWASYLTSNEFDKFISAVSEYFTRQKIGFTMGDGEVKLDKNTVFDIENFGLVNLAQRCKQSPVKEWKAIIKDHFESLQKSAEFEKYFSSKSHDFNFAMQYLGVRLYNNDYIAYLENITPIGKPLTEDIYAMLVFDFPTTVVNVKPEQTIQWNKTNEELFTIGLENIRNNYPIDISTQNIGTTNIAFVQGDHFFVPNIVFDLENKPGLVGEKGALIGIPHRHATLIYPINNLGVVSATNELIPVIAGMNEEGPGSISSELFWYHDGEYVRLPYRIEENKLTFSPPEPFIDMLNTLQSAT